MSRFALRSLMGDTVTYGLSKAVPAAAMFAGVILFVRSVGEAEYGRYSLLVAAAAVVSSIGAGWINQGQLRYYSRYASHAVSYRNAIRWAQGRVGLAILVATGIGALLVWRGAVPALAPWSVVAGGAFAAALMFHTVRVSTFQARLQPRKVATLESIRAVSYLVVPLALLVLVGTTHLALVVGVAVSYVIGGLFIRPRRDPMADHAAGEATPGPRAVDIAREFWAYGWPLSVWLACSMGFQVTDRFLIQHVFSYEETGVYASAYDLIVRSFSLLFFPITLAVHPRIMKAWNDGEVQESVKLIRTALLGQGLLYVPLVLGLVVLGRPVFEFMLGTGVAEQQMELLIPLSLAGLAWQVALIAHKPLELQERTRTMLGVIVFVWVANVVINLTLLPIYGLPVTAYAFAAAGLLYGAVCFGIGWRGMVAHRAETAESASVPGYPAVPSVLEEPSAVEEKPSVLEEKSVLTEVS